MARRQKEDPTPDPATPRDLRDVEAVLHKRRALYSLELLVKRRCERIRILSILKNIREPLFGDTWEDTFGMSRRKLNEFIKRLHGYAEDVEKHNRGWQQFLLSGLNSRAVDLLLQLPELLRLYAHHLDTWRQKAGPKRHPLQNVGRCFLVNYVKTTTGRYCDEEVADVLAAILDNRNYDASRHGRWRRKNCSPPPAKEQNPH